GLVDRRFIDVVLAVLNLINTIPTDAGNLTIAFGSFDLGNLDPRTLRDLRTVRPNVTGTAPSPDQQLNTPQGQNSRQFISRMRNQPGGGLQFPILQEPMSVFQLLLGQDVTLFTFQMPTLAVSFTYSRSFRLPPPLSFLAVRLTGGIEASARFAFGYDTFGLRRFAQTGNVADVFNGFFIDPARTGVTLQARISASAELNLAAVATRPRR